MDTFESLKGFYDRYPAEWSAWRELVDTVEETGREFGFREIDAPSVEPTDLFRVKSGEDIVEETYSFEDKGGREVTLIPEQTPTRARLVQQRKDLGAPIKWFDTSKRWRYEAVQRGRDREFFQTDFDIFGVESVEADGEIIACASTIFKKLGVADSVEFKLNDRQLLDALLRGIGVGESKDVMRVIDKKEKISRDEFLAKLEAEGVDRATAEEIDELTAISGEMESALVELSDKAPENEAANEAIDRMHGLYDVLSAYGVESMCSFDLSIVRGMDYYTGLVFEAFATESDLRALFGGGRYDELIGQFGGQDVPAIGFAFGYSPTMQLLKELDEWPEEAISTDAYVLTISDSVREIGLEYAMELRRGGLKVETDLTDRSVGEQFGYADRINAEYTIVVGERDLNEGVVTVQNMESGEEEKVPKDEVVEHVLKILPR
ncbi:histidine--tRNA ligase [Haladaptatus caseinilyticus]|uniref:histidine--tRNA ligase n=1 Tax=Haladaptatus caseinilyticus TaxID=2993314 RepID=UPI00224A877A|nr:histidine--tRNA ligase [Haladaptatus caseinilyticus]